MPPHQRNGIDESGVTLGIPGARTQGNRAFLPQQPGCERNPGEQSQQQWRGARNSLVGPLALSLHTKVCAHLLEGDFDAPALRAGIDPRDHQPAVRRVDRDVRLGEADRRSAGQAHTPRPHHRNERRQLPPQAEQSGRLRIAFRRQAGHCCRGHFPLTVSDDIYAEQWRQVACYASALDNMSLQADVLTSSRSC